MPAAADDFAVEDEVYLVPVDEDVPDRVIALRVVVAEIVERFVGEHDAEAERVVAPVALEWTSISQPGHAFFASSAK